MTPSALKILSLATLAAMSLLLYACKPTIDSTGPVIEVWKSPTCSCCSKWVEHLKASGFQVNVHNEAQMNPLKRRLGVPAGLASCHTAKVGGYVIEGHVPASDIQRLLAERPIAQGIAVPDMPIGSPGMEQGDRKDPFDVILFGQDDQRHIFASHGGAAASPDTDTASAAGDAP